MGLLHRPVATRTEKFCRRALSVLLVTIVTLFLCAAVLDGFDVLAPTHTTLQVAGGVIGGILFFVMLPLMIVAAHAFKNGRAAVLAADFRICPKCRYVLTGLPSDGACPECGCAYIGETLKIIWKDSYQIREAINTPSTPSLPSPHTHPASPTPPPGASTN